MKTTIFATLVATAFALLPAPPAARAETTLDVAVVSRTIFYLPAWTAEKQGFFKAAGIDAKIEIYDAADRILDDLRAGIRQIGITSIENVIVQSYKGGTLKIVAGSAQRPPHFIIAQPEIKSLADLKGRLIGVVSMQEGTTFFVKDIALKAGFDPSDVRVAAVGGSPTRARLLKERKIDAGLQPYPLSYEAEADGFSNLGAIADLVPDYQFTSVVVDDAWARRNRAVLVAFLRALRRGTDYMFAHRQESAELAARELRTTPALARRALEDTARMDVLARDLSLTDKSLLRVFENVQAAGLVPSGAVYDRAKFVDESYLTESRSD
jgi:ABC-type nitrate/sulfonate/bicarbonate transport system substrate-binding protein